MDIARANLTGAFVAEVGPMLLDHAEELVVHGGEAAAPNWEVYHRLNIAGLLWVFSARDPDGLLVGYLSYIIEPSPHCADVYTAYQDVFYVMPHARGKFVGPRLLSFAEKALKPLVRVIRQEISVTNNFAPMLIRKGYELTGLVYSKEL